MSNLRKIITFTILFAIAFYLIEVNSYLNDRTLLADLGGIPWLFSSIGAIFSIITAFVIQKEWDNWNSLVDAVRGEIDSIEELWLWINHFRSSASQKAKKYIISYLEIVVHEGFEKCEYGERSEKGEQALINFRDALVDVSKDQPNFMSTSFSLFSDLLKNHKDRLRFSSRHLPEILRGTLTFVTFLMIVLPFFIGVKNVWIDYIFTASIATLAYTIYVVIYDLDHPLRPGGWHLTTRGYENLLERLKQS